MKITEQLAVRSNVLKSHVNKYAFLGLAISIGSIIFATLLVSYQLTGQISLGGILRAQATNPALWALNLTPFMFAYWGQAFCYELANKAETIIDDTTKEFEVKSGNLESKLKYESNHDHLTNLPNDRLLSQRINQGIKQLNNAESLALIIININNFKDINYNFGAFSANSLLRQFTEKLKTLLLEPYMLQAYMGMNMVARLQGAEFAILIPRFKHEHNLESMLDNIVKTTSTGFMFDGNNIEIKTTAGVALYPEHGTDDETIIRNATLCLLNAEKEGKRYAIFDPTMDKNYKTKRIRLQELSTAIENEEMDVLYQPTFELDTGKLIGAEALISFAHPKYDLLNDEKLISLVEGSNVVHKLTEFTLRKAVHQLDLWHKAKHKISMTVNLLNATNLELPVFLKNLLKEYNIPAKYLKVELTEKACLSDQTYSIKFLNQLAGLGVKVAISDFCSGYSSFVYLTNFPVSEIKIDKSFVTKMMQEEEKKLAVVRGIIKLAGALNLVVFAEGITDQSILNELKKMGCMYGQGPYLADAATADNFTTLLDSTRTAV